MSRGTPLSPVRSGLESGPGVGVSGRGRGVLEESEWDPKGLGRGGPFGSSLLEPKTGRLSEGAAVCGSITVAWWLARELSVTVVLTSDIRLSELLDLWGRVKWLAVPTGKGMHRILAAGWKPAAHGAGARPQICGRSRAPWESLWSPKIIWLFAFCLWVGDECVYIKRISEL